MVLTTLPDSYYTDETHVFFPEIFNPSSLRGSAIEVAADGSFALVISSGSDSSVRRDHQTGTESAGTRNGGPMDLPGSVASRISTNTTSQIPLDGPFGICLPEIRARALDGGFAPTVRKFSTQNAKTHISMTLSTRSDTRPTVGGTNFGSGTL